MNDLKKKEIGKKQNENNVPLSMGSGLGSVMGLGFSVITIPVLSLSGIVM